MNNNLERLAKSPFPKESDKWTVEANPLATSATSATSYPVNALGDVLSGVVNVVARTTQAPVSMIANSFLASASLATQAYADVELLQGKNVPISLFCITVGDSGERKSAVDSDALSAIQAYQKTLSKERQQKLADYEADRQAYEVALRNAKSPKKGKEKSREEVRRDIQELGQPPVSPIEPLILCSDPTAEGVFRQLAGGQPSIGIFTDEGGLFTSGFAMQDQNKLATLARLSKLWSGDPFDRVRGGDGTAILYNRRLSLHLMMQGIVAKALFSDAISNEQGFLPRCLIAYPESTAGTRFFKDEKVKDSKEFKRFFAVMSGILETPKPTDEEDEQQLNLPVLLMSRPARKMLINFHDQIESELKSDGEYFIIKGTANKIVEQATRIAGVLMVIKHGANDVANELIDDKIMTDAITLAKWYLDEWKRISVAEKIPEKTQLAILLHEWVMSERNPHRPIFYTKQVQRLGHNRLRNRETLSVAIEVLIEHGLCRKIDHTNELDGAVRQAVYQVRPYEVAEVAKVATGDQVNNDADLGSKVAEVAEVATDSDDVYISDDGQEGLF